MRAWGTGFRDPVPLTSKARVLRWEGPKSWEKGWESPAGCVTTTCCSRCPRDWISTTRERLDLRTPGEPFPSGTSGPCPPRARLLPALEYFLSPPHRAPWTSVEGHQRTVPGCTPDTQHRASAQHAVARSPNGRPQGHSEDHRLPLCQPSFCPDSWQGGTRCPPSHCREGAKDREGWAPRSQPPERPFVDTPALSCPHPHHPLSHTKGVYKELFGAPEKTPPSLRDLTTALPDSGDLLCPSLHTVTSVSLRRSPAPRAALLCCVLLSLEGVL